MTARRIQMLFLAAGLMLAPVAVALQMPGNAAPAVLPADYQPWPREVKSGAITYRIHEPHAESWTGAEVRFRAATAVTVDGGIRYGVVYGRARTWSDSANGLVKLDDISLDRANFPTAPDGGEAYLRELQRGVTGTWQVRQEQFGPDHTSRQMVSVRNDPPRIFVSYSPALLVLIDGAPALRKVPDSSFERVINTRSLLLKDASSGRFYLHAFDGWLTAREVQGPWQVLSGEVPGLDKAKEQIAAAGQVDLLDGGEDRPSLKRGAPVIYVSTAPAELIVLQGEPQLEPVAGTRLLWVKNTTAPLLLDTGNDDYFAVISGRWFSARSLNGPWSFAPGEQLPKDFALIPDDHALAPVRAAVPGTPQAREAVIANSVPQTATVSRTGTRFQPTLDGEATLRPIEGTTLQHVANSATPIIRVDENSWYAVQEGVWFTAQRLDGPWEVATWVPPAIYGIPSTSPLHYVTYVQVYGATPNAVYTGYTPGYLGSVVAPAGTVVYGTGVAMSPWIGNAWFGSPWTYGFGWSVGVGPFWPTWSPWIAPWWGPSWGGWWRPPYWGWGWGWGPRPGWGWVRPPVWGWGAHPGWGWGKNPGWGWARPPVFFPPGGVHPPLGVPPVALPQVPRLPPTAFLDSNSRNRYATQPGANLWAQPPTAKGPGWNTMTPTVPGSAAQALPGLPQGFQRITQSNPNLFAAARPAGVQPALPAPGPGVPSPVVGGGVAPNANLFNSLPKGAPSAAQGFRGGPVAPSPNAFGSVYRSAPSAVAPPVTVMPGGASSWRGGPVYAPSVAAPASPALAAPGVPSTYRSSPSIAPGSNLYNRPPPGMPAQAGFPTYSPGAGALPRFNGGMPAPVAPAMIPRGGGVSPGFGGGAMGYGGGMSPSAPAMMQRGGGMPGGGFAAPGFGAPGGGFRGSPMAPRGPGWGGGGGGRR